MADNLRIGIIGIGAMGWPMAANLRAADHPLIAHDLDRARVEAFAAEHGAQPSNGLAGLAEQSDMVITMLPNGPLVRQAVMEDEGGALLASLAPGSIVVDMSSSDPTGTQALGAQLAERGVTLIDAPVSGGVRGAEAGTLSIMVGGEDEDAIEKVWPALEVMGGNLFRTGPLGSGHATKALNNFCGAAAYTAAAEALLIGFKLGLMAKDVKTASDLAEDVGIDAPMSRLVRQLWGDASDDLGPDSDFTGTIRHWEKLNDFEVAPDKSDKKS
jgi:3-hydroxyisobutyrate dehydrogenase